MNAYDCWGRIVIPFCKFRIEGEDESDAWERLHDTPLKDLLAEADTGEYELDNVEVQVDRSPDPDRARDQALDRREV